MIEVPKVKVATFSVEDFLEDIVNMYTNVGNVLVVSHAVYEDRVQGNKGDIKFYSPYIKPPKGNSFWVDELQGLKYDTVIVHKISVQDTLQSYRSEGKGIWKYTYPGVISFLEQLAIKNFVIL